MLMMSRSLDRPAADGSTLIEPACGKFAAWGSYGRRARQASHNHQAQAVRQVGAEQQPSSARRRYTAGLRSGWPITALELWLTDGAFSQGGYRLPVRDLGSFRVM